MKVTLSVDPAGTVTDARIALGHPLFTEATLGAARQWRVSVDSKQVARTIEVLVNYRFTQECP
ncbi:MAG: energy transducer TonB [Acidobacteriota bacterium]|nr:energy transducer TonB [Acidobacteriota bacterium]